MARFHKANLIALLSLSLVACGGGGGDSEPESGSGGGAVPPPSSSKFVSGVYAGYITEGNDKYKTLSIITPDRVTIAELTEGLIFSYRYNISNEHLKGEGLLYGIQTSTKLSTSIQGDVVSPKLIQAEISAVGHSDKLGFIAAHSETKQFKLSDLEGTYVSEIDGTSSYYLDENGSFYGSDGDCEYSGKFVQPDSSATVFTSSMRIYGCEGDDTFNTTIGYIDSRTLSFIDERYRNKDEQDMLLVTFENGKFALGDILTRQ